MRNKKIKEILSTEINAWKTNALFVLDYYDGPLEGFGKFEIPETYFYFRLLGERVESNNLDDRIYTLNIIEYVDFQKIENILKINFKNKSNGTFGFPYSEKLNSDESSEKELSFTLTEIISKLDSPELIVRSRDFNSFLNVWRITGLNMLSKSAKID